MKSKIELTSAHKIEKSKQVSYHIFCILFAIAFTLILISYFCDDWVESFFLSLGTGAATSAVVSLAFYLIENEMKKRESIKIRLNFMESFKVFYYNLICVIDFSVCDGENISLERYIKLQHQWFHEYYKRMVADNFSEPETDLRVQQIKEMLQYVHSSFYCSFECGLNWQNGDFTNRQYQELHSCYTDFKNMLFHLETNNYEKAFFEMAYFLETIKRMLEEFIELENFKLISLKNNGDVLEFQWEEFEKKEQSFAFARNFNRIRQSNYKKYYSETA